MFFARHSSSWRSARSSCVASIATEIAKPRPARTASTIHGNGLKRYQARRSSNTGCFAVQATRLAMFLKKSFADMTASMVGSGGPGVKVKCPLRARRGRGWRNGRESRRVTSRKRHSEKGETMTNAQAVGVGVRLFSIWLVVYVIRGGPALWVMNAREGDTSGMAVVLAVM